MGGMSDRKELVTKLFKSHNINVPGIRKELFDKFLEDEENIATINTIIQNLFLFHIFEIIFLNDAVITHLKRFV